jgi:hypothetical protein
VPDSIGEGELTKSNYDELIPPQASQKVLESYHEQIKEYLELGLSLRRIRIIINLQLE